jgi:dTMP kinase
MFITFEGQDGSGKSSIIKKLKSFLEKEGINFVLTREPGSPYSKESKQIRDILLKKENVLPPLTEALLFAADRRMHLNKIIIPALNQNKVVICDRYIDSSLVYQGFGRNIGIDKVKIINEIVTEGKYPDLTIFLDVSLKNSLKRIDSREAQDRFEITNKNFKKRVDEGYKKVVKMFPNRFKVIDSNQKEELVFEEVIKIIKKFLKI